MTRLRLDEVNYVAVWNAILLNPKARCKAEVALPLSYPRILSVEYEGGFLDGVHVEPSANLTCFIGGRGSGKSTALIAIRAAAAAELGTADDPDDPRRMPDRTLMRFVDRFGSERTAVRERGADPYDAATGAPIELKLADLAQDESGELARAYDTNPQPLLDYLDGFCDLSSITNVEHSIEERLEANAEELKRTWVQKAELDRVQKERQRLVADLDAAKLSRLDEVAEWSDVLSSQSAVLRALESALAAAGALPVPAIHIDLDDLAKTYGADLAKRPAAGAVEGEGGIRAQVGVFERDLAAARTSYATTVVAAQKRVEPTLSGWHEQLRELEARRAAKEEELKAKGLHVQAGEVKRLTEHLAMVSTSLSQLTVRVREHGIALWARKKLLDELEAIRDKRFEARRATLKRITTTANAASDGPQIHAYFRRAGQTGPWARWLSARFKFRAPRVDRIAAGVSPGRLAQEIWAGDLKALVVDGQPFAPDPGAVDDAWPGIATWDVRFELETWRLEDLPRLELEERPGAPRRPFNHLSAGQQRSILLSLMLFAPQSDPLVLDQPEDHLDAQYLSTAVVRHLEAAKERRQVIVATHSANLTVLGDAELVVPMFSDGTHGRPEQPGAVDSSATREMVCALLEGGRDAFRRRGERYGFQILAGVPS